MTAENHAVARRQRHETRAEIPELAGAIRNLILGHERIAILTHSNPDVDAVASALTMRTVCRQLGRDPILTVTGDGTVPENLMFLDDVLSLTAPSTPDLEAANLVIFVDCAEASRVGSLFETCKEFLASHPATINIDHHVTNTRFATLNCVIPDAAATAEILAQFCNALDVPIDRTLATSLLAGIYGDTLGLRTPSTTPATMRVSASLLETGADIDRIVDWLFRVKPFSAVKLWAEALSRVAWAGPVVWTYIDRDMLERTQAVPAQAEGMINFLAGTVGARASVLAYEEPSGWRVSLRSVRNDVDVAEIASGFGGGGHARAAGLRIEGDLNTLNTFVSDIGNLVAALPAGTDEYGTT